jgi:hypothetical protein
VARAVRASRLMSAESAINLNWQEKCRMRRSR